MIIIIVLFFSVATTCANPLITLESRIIGGTPAEEKQFPFAASIYTNTVLGTFFCGGSLITTQYILTAAQCVHGVFEFTIRLGSTKLINGGENSIVIKATAYYITLGWNSLTFENDIGLINLDAPVSVTDYIRPVQVLATTTLPDSDSVISLGWGQTRDDTLGLENNLKFVNLVSLNNDECQLTYGDQIVDTMVCVGGEANEGTCFGDTGGALISYKNETEALVGVASFVSGRGCESQDPSGFIRIESYVDWINQVIENVG